MIAIVQKCILLLLPLLILLFLLRLNIIHMYIYKTSEGV